MHGEELEPFHADAHPRTKNTHDRRPPISGQMQCNLTPCARRARGRGWGQTRPVCLHISLLQALGQLLLSLQQVTVQKIFQLGHMSLNLHALCCHLAQLTLQVVQLSKMCVHITVTTGDGQSLTVTIYLFTNQCRYLMVCPSLALRAQHALTL